MAIGTVLAVSSGIKAIGSFRSSRAQKSAAKEGRAIAESNALLLEKQNAETERRAADDIKKVEGEIRARSYASGSGAGDVNQELVISSLVDENAKQFEWLKLSGEEAVNSVRINADFQQSMAEAQARATMWQGFGQIVSSVGFASEAGVFGSQPTSSVPYTNQPRI